MNELTAEDDRSVRDAGGAHDAIALARDSPKPRTVSAAGFRPGADPHSSWISAVTSGMGQAPALRKIVSMTSSISVHMSAAAPSPCPTSG